MIFVVLFLVFFSTNIQIFSLDGEIVFNPTGNTPLSAVFKMKKINDTRISVFIRGKTPLFTISYTFPENYGSVLPLHGFYPDQINTVVIKPANEEQKIYQIKIPPIKIESKGSPQPGIEPDAGVPIKIRTKVLVDTLPSPQIQNQDLFFISLPNAGSVIALDRRGDIRYAYQPKNGKPYLVRMAQENNEIFMYVIDGNKSFQKLNMMGRPVFEYNMNVHHDFVPYKDDQYLILANTKYGWEDGVSIINNKGKVISNLMIGDAIRNAVNEYEDEELLDSLIFDNKNPYQFKGKSKRADWAHANSLIYDRENDLLYVSLRHQGILGINMTDWRMEWFLTDDTLNVERGMKYATAPEEMIFLKDIPSFERLRMHATLSNAGPVGQHAIFLRKNGNLVLFDNQADQKDNPFGSRVIEYAMNKNSMIAQVLMRFQPPEKNYSRFVSDVDITGDFYQNKLILYGYGTMRRILEIDPQSATLFDMIIDSQAIMYRIDKFPVYPYREPRRKYTLDYIEP